MVLELVEMSHANLAKVPRVILVEIGSVVVLTTGHTSTAGMLAMLAYTTMASGYVAATARVEDVSNHCRRQLRKETHAPSIAAGDVSQDRM